VRHPAAYPSSKCEKCPLLERVDKYHVSAEKPDTARIALVGEAPGEKEVTLRRPFVGRSGILMDQLIAAAGIRRSECVVTNVLKCQPQGNKLPNDYQLDIAIGCCSEILAEDTSGVEVIVGFGATPLRAFMRLDRITQRRGSVYRLPSGQLYVATLHPAFLLRGTFVQAKQDETKVLPPQVVINDLRKARRILDGSFEEVVENFVLYPTADDMMAFLERLEEPDVLVGVDIETTYVDTWRSAQLRTIAFAFPDLAIAVAADTDENLMFIIEALESPARKVFHNGIFDVSVLEETGFEVVNWFADDQYMHHLGYAELPHSLAFVQSIYNNMPYHKDMRDEIAEEYEK